MTTKFSIVTITRNNSDGLKCTAKSVQSQSFRDFEWIIIDGNSTDDTKNYLTTLTAIIVSEPDNGIYDAMNKGLALAKGDYVLFLNAGDTLSDPEILSLINQHINVTPSDFIYGDAMEHDGKRFHIKRARPHKKIMQGMFTHHQAMIYRRELLQTLRFDTAYRIAGDYDLTLRFLKLCKDVSYIPSPLCLFAYGGISQSNPELGRHEQFRAKMANNPKYFPWYAIIYAWQTIAVMGKKNFPRTYWFFRSRAA